MWDDMLIAGRSGSEIDALKKRLMDAFEMKDLGDFKSYPWYVNNQR